MLSLYKLPALKINENKVRNPFNELMCNCVRLGIHSLMSLGDNDSESESSTTPPQF